MGALRTRCLEDLASTGHLIRPDQHVAARWAGFEAAGLAAALRTACARETA
jgi:3-(3-hydroxy-phenyl)propionate hydroxylase